VIYSKILIEKFSHETGFIGSNIEKVIRLLDVLDFIFSKSSFQEKLVLKGGTAINLAYTNLARLSVDIDLDYHGSILREVAVADREKISNELDSFMLSEQYELSPKTRQSTALLSKVYRYRNAFGNLDNVKVEINFMDRISLYPPVANEICYFGKKAVVKTLAIEELFGMKIAALIDRSKPRDLYDAAYLLKQDKPLQQSALKKAAIFYLSLDGIFFFDSNLFHGIKSITWKEIKTELLPVLKKGEKFNLPLCSEQIVNLLLGLLALDENENEYLAKFSKGNYNPFLLFEKEIGQRAEQHPMAKWKEMNLKKKSQS